MTDAIKDEPKDIVELVNNTMDETYLMQNQLAERELRPDGQHYQLYPFPDLSTLTMPAHTSIP